MIDLKSEQEKIQELIQSESNYFEGDVLETPADRKEWLSNLAGEIGHRLLPNQRVRVEVITENETNQQLSFIAEMGSEMDDGRTFCLHKHTTPVEFEQLFHKYAETLSGDLTADTKREIIFNAKNTVLRGEDES